MQKNVLLGKFYISMQSGVPIRIYTIYYCLVYEDQLISSELNVKVNKSLRASKTLYD